MHRTRARARGVLLAAIAVVVLPLCVHMGAQGGPAPAGPPQTAKAGAPIDLRGYWVSIVSEDWRWRMVTPAKGDYASIPITAEAKKVADVWDPAKDEASGEACKSYGAPALLRIPGRVHIAWQDDTTLMVETDAGMQTRVLHFGATRKTPSRERTWQGDSVAEWEKPRAVRGGGVGEAAPQFGSLKVVTTNLRPGYLRKNGVPYSANAVLTEYWDLHNESNGDQWLVITTVVEDPLYLREPWLTALHFKKEPNGAKWDPTPCSARW